MTIHTNLIVPSIGSVLAAIISWSVNKSVAWAIIHGLFSWFYIAYYALESL